ncbi:MAG: alpha/beta fold hydrolase [Thermoleophilaceae bacterium]
MTRVRLALVALVLLSLAAPSVARAAAPSPSIVAKTKTVKAGKIRIGYREFGKGSPVVFVMGLFGTMDVWDPEFLDPLAKHHRVIVFDNRGIGRSTDTSASFTIHDMGEDTAHLIKALKLDKPGLVGWSMGGFIAQDVAINHPKLISRLVLNSTGPQAPRFVAPSAEIIGKLFGPMPSQADILATLFPPAQEAQLQGWIGRFTKRQPLEAVPPATAKKQTLAVAGWAGGTGTDDPKRIKVPTLVGAGLDDTLIPPQNARVLAKRIPHAKLKLFRDASHAFLFQERKTWVPRIERFLKTGR